MPTADVAGFVAAQANLRATLGAPITFKVPIAEVWPEGTKINPDTGEPYDSTIKPTSDPYTDVVKTCLIILKQGSPLRPQPDTVSSPLGEVSGMDIIIDISTGDYEDVEDASEMLAQGKLYRIREAKPFSLAGQGYRYLIYGMEK